MILHIAEDEKFIDTAISLFEEVYPNRNDFVIFIDSSGYVLKYIKQKNKVRTIVSSLENINNLISNLKKYDFVILHNLFSYKWPLILNSSSDIKFHWIEWGADLYNVPSFNKKLFLPNTKRIVEKNFNYLGKTLYKIEKYYPWLFDKYHLVRYSTHSFEHKFRQVLKKIYSVSTVVNDEYNLILKINKNIKYFPFFYGSYKNYITENISNYDTKIYIGNSASPSSNHIDILSILKKYINKNKVIIPLSYGLCYYRDEVIKIINKSFSNMNIEILKDFIPLDEYNKKIGSCSFFIFGHKRQQAMGNIISALWMGSSVFLYEDNPVYKFLKKSNFFVFEIKKFNQNYNELILTKEQKEINRELIKKIFNENEALKNIENIYNMLKN